MIGALCRWAAAGRTTPTFAAAPLAFILAMAGVGLAASPDPSAGLPAFWRIVFGIAACTILADGIRTAAHARRAAYLLAAGSIGVALLTVFGTNWAQVRFAALPDLYGRIPALLRDVSDQRAFNPRVMGMALAMLFPLCLSLALAAGGRGRALRLLAGAGALATAAVLPLTQAVQAVLGVGVALFLLAVWRTRWALLAVPGGLGLLAWAATRADARALALRLVSLVDVAGIGVALRLDMWSRAWDMLADMPFTGAGLDSFPIMVWHFYPGYMLGPEPHAHNLYLQLALDLGLPGLAAFTALMAAAGLTAVRALRRARDPELAALVAGLAAGVAAYLAAGTIDTPWASKPGILLWILLGVLAGAGRVAAGDRVEAGLGDYKPPPEGEKRPRAFQLGIAACAIPLAVAAALVLLPGVRERNVGTLVAQKAIFSVRTAPGASQASAEALRSATGHLQRAVDLGAGDAHTFSLLGSVYSWQGDYAASLDAFERQVALDAVAPMARYAPFEALRRALSGEPGPGAAADLLAVYGQWMARFPGRAEPYAWAAIVHEQRLGDAGRAASTLEAGLKQGAQPAGLLQFYLARLPGGG